ncbi:hypothetical protein DPMN_138750 [Dreissena polymorpha]|uniref:Uncharacterized protein n=1 Tax=Dreissena polymorpha TaxID=45954 RepID=A0A9D4G7V8_DREPO|nr:hypothetical protein DPMN_138750 [Dreissena polymorpha]
MKGLESLIDSLQSDEVALENADPTQPSNTAPVVSSVVNMATKTDSRQKSMCVVCGLITIYYY